MNKLPVRYEASIIIEAFLTLSANKVVKIIKITNNNIGNKKLKINIITKEPSRKQIMVPMNKTNTELIINSAYSHITNINKYLKDIKSDIVTSFIHRVNNRIIITTNQIVANSDMKFIKKYLKNINEINSDESSYQPSSKLYMKIIGLSYMLKYTNSPIISNIHKSVIREIHLFNDIVLMSKSWIIKAFPKSDIAVI